MNAPVQIGPTGRGMTAPVPTVRHDRFTIPLVPPGPMRFFRDNLLVPHSRGELLRTKLARVASPFWPFPGVPAHRADGEIPLALLTDALHREGLAKGPLTAITLSDYEHSNREKMVAFLFEGRAERPWLIAKTSGDPPHAERLGHELHVLGALRSRLDEDLRETLPMPVAEVAVGSATAYCQRPLVGCAMYVETRNSLAPARLVTGHFALAGEWLAQFQLATSGGHIALAASGAIEALQGLRDLPHPLSPGTADYISDVLRRSEGLADLRLPLAACHGDFWARNLLVDGPRLGVIDWDGFRDSASVFEDLFHFVTSYGQSFAWELGRWSDPVAAFRSTFARGGTMGGVISATLRAHCSRLAVPPEALGVLFPAFLAQRALARGGVWLRLFEEFAGMDRCACFGS